MSADDWQGVLRDGETLLWHGHPDRAFHVARARLRAALLAIACVGCAAFFVTARAPEETIWLALVAFLVFGLAILGHALIWPTFRRRHTRYALTNLRALIATDLPLFGHRLHDYPITRNTPIRLEDGTPGSVWFAREFRKTKEGSRRVDIGFERIPAPREVLSLMNRQQRGQDARA